MFIRNLVFMTMFCISSSQNLTDVILELNDIKAMLLTIQNGVELANLMCGRSNYPTVYPTEHPSFEPTDTPTSLPTVPPSAQPTLFPTAVPTTAPTDVPSALPTFAPTATPTLIPTAAPTAVPTAVPTSAPTAVPTAVPTAAPTAVPTAVPSTASPTVTPTATPTAHPTVAPTATPSYYPSSRPSLRPNRHPTSMPSTKVFFTGHYTSGLVYINDNNYNSNPFTSWTGQQNFSMYWHSVDPGGSWDMGISAQMTTGTLECVLKKNGTYLGQTIWTAYSAMPVGGTKWVPSYTGTDWRTNSQALPPHYQIHIQCGCVSAGCSGDMQAYLSGYS